MTERSKKAAATRQRILDSAQKLIGQCGYDRVTVDDIVADCGVAKGTFYHYFKSKSEIFLCLSGSVYDKLQAEADFEACAGIMANLHALIGQWYREVSTYNLHFAREAIKLYTASADVGEYGEKISHIEQGIDLIHACLLDGLSRGELAPDTPVDTIAKALMFSMQGSTIYHCKHEIDFDVLKWSEEFIRHVVDPLLAPWLSGGAK